MIVLIILISIHRQLRTRDHPKTPPKHLKYSRRAWEGLVKAWRKKLHTFDDPHDSLDKDDDNATF
jgi:histone RNA hairpin-binding protein